MSSFNMDEYLSRRALLMMFLFFLASLLVNLPSLFTCFDPEEYMTFLNPLIRGDSLGKYLLNAYSWFMDGVRVGFIRPLTGLTFLAEYPLFGSIPWLYRVVTLLIHAACCMVLLAVMKQFTGKSTFPAGLTAALAPGTVYAIWFISARGDVLAPLFSLLALLYSIRLKKENPSWRSWVLPPVFVLLALASKEAGLASIPAVALSLLLYPSEHPPGKLNRKGLAVLSIGTGLVLAVYLAARFFIFGGIGGYAGGLNAISAGRNTLVILLQSCGAWFIPWKPVRWIYLVAVHVPVVLFAVSSRRNFFKALLLSMMLLVFSFQSMIGAAVNHYIYGPAIVWVLLLFVSVYGIDRKVITGTVSLILPLLFALLSIRNGLHNRYTAEPLCRVQISAGIVYPEVKEWEFPIYVYSSSRSDPGSNSELKNLQLYFSYHAGGLPDELDLVEISSRLPAAGRRYLLWNGEEFQPVIP